MPEKPSGRMAATFSAGAAPGGHAGRRRCTPSTGLAGVTSPAAKKKSSPTRPPSGQASARPTAPTSPPANLGAIGPWAFPAAAARRSGRAARACRVRWGLADGPTRAAIPWGRMPGVVRVHRLEIVGPEHQDDEGQGRMDFDALGQSVEAAAARFERVVPDGAPALRQSSITAPAAPRR